MTKEQDERMVLAVERIAECVKFSDNNFNEISEKLGLIDETIQERLSEIEKTLDLIYAVLPAS